MQIIVLGMHRSGTSAITRVINLMGASIGREEQLMSPKPDNPRGFWERRDVSDINDSLLRSVGASWNDIAGFDVKALPHEAVEKAAAGAASIIATLDEDRPWVLKDPRFCLLLSVWRQWLDTPICVLVHRCPVETALSIKERNGHPLSFGVALWERYVLDALNHSRGLPRTLVSYEEMITNPEATATDLLKRLRVFGCKGLHKPDPGEVAGFINQDLRHHQQRSPLDLEVLNDSQRALAQSMRDGSALDLDHQKIPSVGARDVMQFHRVEIERKRSGENLAAKNRELNQKLDKARSDGIDLARGLAASREGNQQAVVDLGEAQIQKARLEAEAHNAREREQDKAEKIASLTAEIEVARERQEDLEAQLNNAREQEQDKAEKIASLTAEIEVARERQEDLKAQLNNAREQEQKLAKAREAKARRREKETASLTAELEVAQERQRTLSDRLNEQAHAHEARLTAVREHLDSVATTLEDERRAARGLNDSIAEFRSRLAREEERRAGLDQESDRLRDQLADLAAERTHLNQVVAELQARNATSQRWRPGQVSPHVPPLQTAVDSRRGAAKLEARSQEWRSDRIRVRSQEELQRRCEELQRRDELIKTLAGELRRVLTSRRWRMVMVFVRVIKAVTGKHEGDLLETHLNRHLRALSDVAVVNGERRQIVSSDQLKKKLDEYRQLVLDPPKTGNEMKVLAKERTRELKEALLQCSQTALVTVVMPTWNRVQELPRAIESVRRQTYQNWELIIVDDGSDDDTEAVVRGLAETDRRIHYRRIEHQGVSAARNEGLRAAHGEIVTYLDSDNIWQPNYLLFTVNAIIESDRGCAYSALKIIDHDQNDKTSFRKRVFDLDCLLKNNHVDINAFGHRAELATDLGGFDEDLARWVDWDLILRFVRTYPPAQIPVVLCHYSRKKKLCQITTEEPEAYKFKVLNKHLIDWESLVNRASDRLAGHTSIVIPVFGKVELTDSCLESIYRNTAAGTFDVVVVDNGSPKDEQSALANLVGRYQDCSLVKNYENYLFALGNNLGVAATKGEFVVLLNNDTEVLPGWLEALLDPLRDDDSIGVVGPKLLYPDDTLQCGGLVFNDRSPIPYHIYRGMPRHHPAVCRPRYFQVVTGACMALRASDYALLKGLDPLFVNGGEDVDFCLRIQRDLGKLVYYNPESEIYHLEGKSPGRGRFISYNRSLLVERWGHAVVPDDTKYYDEDGFEVERYHKPGTEVHGETAAYVPVLLEIERSEPSGTTELHRFHLARSSGRLLNVGFSTMWYARGVSFVTKQLADALEGPSIRTHIFARWESQKFTNAGPIFHPRVFNAGDDPSPEEIVTWAKANQLDLMIFMEVHPKDWKRVEALMNAGVRVMCYEHLDVLRLEHWDRYEIFDYFLFNNFYARDVMLGKFPDTPSLTLPWGIPSLPICAPRERTKDLPLRFVHVAGWGGINNRKNSDLLIRAFDRAGTIDAELHLYTQAPIAKYGEECVRITQANPRIKVHEGTINDIFEAYQDMDMLLWPSKREGLGLPIVEALASGIPALVTDGYMMKQWIIDGKHGLLCPATPEETMMYLPEMRVDEEKLCALLNEIAGDRQGVEAMKARVRRNRYLWMWSWQRNVLRDQIRRIAEGPDYVPPGVDVYVPEYYRNFETERQAAEREERAFNSRPGS